MAMPPTTFSAPADVLAVLGQADPLVAAPVPPNIDSRLAAGETNTADLQRRVAAIETS
jgi:hypothetical protein